MKFISTFTNKPKDMKRACYRLLLAAACYLLCVLIISAFLLKKEKREQIAEHTEQSAAALDQKIQNVLYNYMESNLNRYIKPSNISYFYYDEPDLYDDKLSILRISIVDSLRYNTDIHDVTLYRSSDDAVISAVNPGYNITGVSSTFEYVRTVLSMERPRGPGFLTLPSGDFYYYYPVSSYTNAISQYAGFALAKLRSPEDFFRTAPEGLNPNGTFVVLKDGHPLAAQGNNVLSEQSLSGLLKKAAPNTFYTGKATDVSAYNMYYISSEESDLQYVYYEPKMPTLFYLSYAMKSGFLYPLLFSVFGIIVLYALSLFFIAELSDKLSEPGKEPLSDPEPKRALPGQPGDYFPPGTPLPYYSGLVIQYRIKPDSTEKKEVRERIRKAAEEYLTACRLSHSVLIRQNTVNCYINYSDYNLRVLAKALIQVLYTTIDACDFNIFYTSQTETYQDHLRGMDYLCDHLSYSVILGYAKTFSQEQLTQCDANPEPVDPDAIRVLKRMLDERDFDSLTAYIEDKKNWILVNRPSLNSVSHFLEAVFYTVKSYFTINSFSHPINGLTLPEITARHAGIENIMDYLLSCVGEYRKMLEESSQNGANRYGKAIRCYVAQNITTVTLNSLAEHFNMTPAHLSRLFKENEGINFSEYLSERKLEKAKELLENNPKMTISEIAKYLGYNTPAYFSTKFKESLGITPGAYRKRYLMRGDTQTEG